MTEVIFALSFCARVMEKVGCLQGEEVVSWEGVGGGVCDITTGNDLRPVFLRHSFQQHYHILIQVLWQPDGP